MDFMPEDFAKFKLTKEDAHWILDIGHYAS
jgi:hypothetical protein